MADLRAQQIQALARAFPDIETQSPNSIYRLMFRTNAGTALALMIRLGPHFPRAPPELFISPAAPHRLLAASGQITPAYPRLASWDPHCDVSTVVRELLDVFRQEPPGFSPPSYPSATGSFYAQPPPPSASASFTGGLPPPTAASFLGGASPPAVQPASSEGDWRLPAIPGRFPELDAYSEAELAEMLRDEKMLEALFERLDVVQEIRRRREELRDSNAELARSNLALEEAARAKRSELVKKQNDLAVRRSLYEAKRREKDEIAQRFSSPAVAQEIAKSLAQINSQSEELVGQYFKSQLDWHAFSDQYVDARKLYHQRAAMREALLADGRR